MGVGCLPLAVVGSECISVSTVRPDRALSRESTEGQSHSHVDSANVAGTAMVPDVVVNGNTQSNTTTNFKRPTSVSTGGNSSPGTNRESPAGSLESLGGCPETATLSERSRSLYAHAWRPGTQSSYHSSWGRWNRWCHGKQSDPVRAPLELVIEFLTHLFDEGLQYRTINTYRSAISRGHTQVDGKPVGQARMVITHMRAIFNLRVPQPRYECTWDVDRVLDTMLSWGKSSDLSSKMLSLKITMLLALVTAGRGSEIQAIDVHYMRQETDSVTFKLPKPTKTDHAGSALPRISLTRYTDPQLCVVECLELYLKSTAQWRESTDGVERNNLLLSYVKPNKPITAASVARWLKTTIGMSGIDTGVFKAHSTRSAATSKAYLCGLSVTDILQKANWSKDSTFKRFYCRRTDKPVDKFQEAVLLR
jgi:hypothetical protein